MGEGGGLVGVTMAIMTGAVMTGAASVVVSTIGAVTVVEEQIVVGKMAGDRIGAVIGLGLGAMSGSGSS